MSTITATRTAPTTASRFARVPVSVVAAGALVVGGVVTEVYTQLARIVGVDFVFGTNGSEAGEVPDGGFIGAVVMFGALGVLLAPALARWARSPRRAWTRTAWTLSLASLLPVAPVAEAPVSTEIALGIAHLVAAAVVIPIVARRLPESNPKRG